MDAIAIAERKTPIVRDRINIYLVARLKTTPASAEFANFLPGNATRITTIPEMDAIATVDFPIPIVKLRLYHFGDAPIKLDILAKLELASRIREDPFHLNGLATFIIIMRKTDAIANAELTILIVGM